MKENEIMVAAISRRRWREGVERTLVEMHIGDPDMMAIMPVHATNVSSRAAVRRARWSVQGEYLNQWALSAVGHELTVTSGRLRVPELNINSHPDSGWSSAKCETAGKDDRRPRNRSAAGASRYFAKRR